MSGNRPMHRLAIVNAALQSAAHFFNDIRQNRT